MNTTPLKVGDPVLAPIGGRDVATKIIKLNGPFARLDITRGARQYGRHLVRHVDTLKRPPAHHITEGKCRECGSDMIGNGYTSAMHCENAEAPDCAEPDSGPWYCGEVTP